ncbi:hypothetical protein V6N11_035938 [Hibiscus sabdariffa]|uniref:Uncharacterized protein n=1 Tax=Hibiscus sabdariffa TaxID=183260 RepID=A0ABR2R9D8_9ROSI
MSGFRKHSGDLVALNEGMKNVEKEDGTLWPIESPPRWDDRKVPLKDYDAQTPLRPTAVASFTTDISLQRHVHTSIFQLLA